MVLQSESALSIRDYIKSHPTCKLGKYKVEISGKVEALSYYKLPIDLLLYNPDNGRLAMEKRDWEEKEGRSLTNEDADEIRRLLLELEEDKTKKLRADIRQKGQIEPGVITFDGVVINGNRRMAIIQELHKEEAHGKWKFLEAAILPEEIGEQDLWKIEAGLQLSKEKVAPYHPVNDLLKLKQGLDRELSLDELAAAMYGWDPQKVQESLERLELIEQFLEMIHKKDDYGVIKDLRLNEYFINVQKYIVATAEKKRVPKRQKTKYIRYAFRVIQSIALEKKETKKKGRGHMEIRRLGEILNDPDVFAEFEDAINEGGGVTKVSRSRILDAFDDAKELIKLKAYKARPTKLIDRAIKALKSINRGNPSFKDDEVREKITELHKLVREIERELKK